MGNYIVHICGAYIHDHILDFNFLCEHRHNFIIYAAVNRESPAGYRFLNSYIIKEIGTLMWIGVFCVHKPGFLMPGHNYLQHTLLGMGEICSLI